MAPTTPLPAEKSVDDSEAKPGVEEVPELTLSRPDVTTKYRAASDITNAALEAVVKGCVAGASIAALCAKGDAYIEEKTSAMYNKKVEGGKLKKGVAFPTAISVNEICGNFRPMPTDTILLKQGDVCKVDLGCHIDGFITLGAHTVIVPAADGSLPPVVGRKADVLMAAWTAAEAALRLLRPGRTNMEVTAMMQRSMEQFKCSPLRGVLSHQMKQHVIDGSRVIISREGTDEKVDEFEFALNEVYAIDVFASTGEGKTKDAEPKATIFKRDSAQQYVLKSQMGRKFVHEVNSKYPVLPFTVCAFEDANMARLGVAECMRHELLTSYPVLSEFKASESVAQFKFTVLLLPGGTKKVTGLPFSQAPLIKSEYSVTDAELIKLLASPAGPPTKKKAKAKSAAVPSAEISEATKQTDKE